MWRLVSPVKGVSVVGGGVAVNALEGCVGRKVGVTNLGGVVGEEVPGERGLQAEKISSERTASRRILNWRGIGIFQ